MDYIGYEDNEIGTIQPIKHLSDIVHKYCGIFHTDAVQAFPEYHINVKEYGIDMMTVSGHKFGCPKGIGLLYKSSKIDIEPLIHGVVRNLVYEPELKTYRTLQVSVKQLIC